MRERGLRDSSRAFWPGLLKGWKTERSWLGRQGEVWVWPACVYRGTWPVRSRRRARVSQAKSGVKMGFPCWAWSARSWGDWAQQRGGCSGGPGSSVLHGWGYKETLWEGWGGAARVGEREGKEEEKRVKLIEKMEEPQWPLFNNSQSLRDNIKKNLGGEGVWGGWITLLKTWI